jgi:hypothetical protein
VKPLPFAVAFLAALTAAPGAVAEPVARCDYLPRPVLGFGHGLAIWALKLEQGPVPSASPIGADVVTA